MLEISKSFTQYPNISNFLIDGATDWAGEAEWLTFVTRFYDKKCPEWTRNRPISFNSKFSYVVYPDGSTTNVPLPQKVYEWLEWNRNSEISAPNLED